MPKYRYNGEEYGDFEPETNYGHQYGVLGNKIDIPI